MSRDIPAIDAIIAGFCSSHDEPNAAEQAIAFDQSLERSGWSIVRTEELERPRTALSELEAERDRLRGMIYRMSEEMRRELDGQIWQDRK